MELSKKIDKTFDLNKIFNADAISFYLIYSYDVSNTYEMIKYLYNDKIQIYGSSNIFELNISKMDIFANVFLNKLTEISNTVKQFKKTPLAWFLNKIVSWENNKFISFFKKNNIFIIAILSQIIAFFLPFLIDAISKRDVSWIPLSTVFSLFILMWCLLFLFNFIYKSDKNKYLKRVFKLLNRHFEKEIKNNKINKNIYLVISFNKEYIKDKENLEFLNDLMTCFSELKNTNIIDQNAFDIICLLESENYQQSEYSNTSIINFLESKAISIPLNSGIYEYSQFLVKKMFVNAVFKKLKASIWWKDDVESQHISNISSYEEISEMLTSILNRNNLNLINDFIHEIETNLMKINNMLEFIDKKLFMFLIILKIFYKKTYSDFGAFLFANSQSSDNLKEIFLKSLLESNINMSEQYKKLNINTDKILSHKFVYRLIELNSSEVYKLKKLVQNEISIHIIKEPQKLLNYFLKFCSNFYKFDSAYELFWTTEAVAKKVWLLNDKYSWSEENFNNLFLLINKEIDNANNNKALNNSLFLQKNDNFLIVEILNKFTNLNNKVNPVYLEKIKEIDNRLKNTQIDKISNYHNLYTNPDTISPELEINLKHIIKLEFSIFSHCLTNLLAIFEFTNDAEDEIEKYDDILYLDFIDSKEKSIVIDTTKCNLFIKHLRPFIKHTLEYLENKKPNKYILNARYEALFSSRKSEIIDSNNVADLKITFENILKEMIYKIYIMSDFYNEIFNNIDNELSLEQYKLKYICDENISIEPFFSLKRKFTWNHSMNKSNMGSSENIYPQLEQWINKITTEYSKLSGNVILENIHNDSFQFISDFNLYNKCSVNKNSKNKTNNYFECDNFLSYCLNIYSKKLINVKIANKQTNQEHMLEILRGKQNSFAKFIDFNQNPKNQILKDKLFWTNEQTRNLTCILSNESIQALICCLSWSLILSSHKESYVIYNHICSNRSILNFKLLNSKNAPLKEIIILTSNLNENELSELLSFKNYLLKKYDDLILVNADISIS